MERLSDFDALLALHRDLCDNHHCYYNVVSRHNIGTDRDTHRHLRDHVAEMLTDPTRLPDPLSRRAEWRH